MKKEPTVFWIGDSIALHYQPYLLASLQGIARLEFRQGYREAVQNLDHPRGANCGDSSMVLAFLRSLLERPNFAAEWIVFNCGLHDIKTDPVSGRSQIELKEYARNLVDIVELILENHRQPVWMSTTPVDDARHLTHCPEILRHEHDVRLYNAWAAEIMRERAVPTIDLHRFTASLGCHMYCDHVHYAEEARRQQGEFLSREFQALLSKATVGVVL